MVLVNKITTSACRNHKRTLHGITTLLYFLFAYYFILFSFIYRVRGHISTQSFVNNNFHMSARYTLYYRLIEIWEILCIIVLKSPPINIEVEHVHPNHIHIWKMIKSNHPSGKPYIWCICRYTVCTVPD